ncbi:MAG: hypothetical protein GY869_31585, partial [Planctomycetes bacterium]|nr:hypothetical protein [Planctomycetota bacterium]
MSKKHLSRREFIRLAGRYGFILGGAGLVLSNPSWLSRICQSGEALAGPYDNELLRTARLAKYWVSTATKDVACQTCHNPDEIDPTQEYEHEGTAVKCLLCAQECLVDEGKRGKCRARMNIEGELRSLVYGRPISVHVDPIEKKPFYHYRPGSNAFSLATAGCPLSCQFCQNWQISQSRPEDYPVQFNAPQVIVDTTKDRKAPIIAFTYNEPTVFFEYMVDIAE